MAQGDRAEPLTRTVRWIRSDERFTFTIKFELIGS